MHTITLIPGDGIGPSVTEAAIRVIEASGVKIKWERMLAGMTALKEKGDPLPQETLDSILRNRVALKGPCDTPIGGGFSSVNVALRKQFNLYANIRPVKSIPGVKSRYENVDLVVCRENVEDVYGGEEYYLDRRGDIVETKTGKAMMHGLITEDNCVKFFRKVFDYAESNGRKNITIVHKANILKKTHGLFLEVGNSVADFYPKIKVDYRIIDNMCMQLVLYPSYFDFIATTNMFGDILSDLCAGLVGGLGFAPGANIGDGMAIFEAVHGTAPDIVGKDIANPTALILSAAMMLDYIGEPEAGKIVRKAVEKVIADGIKVTKDINPRLGGVGTQEMANEIAYTVADLSRGA